MINLYTINDLMLHHYISRRLGMLPLLCSVCEHCNAEGCSITSFELRTASCLRSASSYVCTRVYSGQSFYIQAPDPSTSGRSSMLAGRDGRRVASRTPVRKDAFPASLYQQTLIHLSFACASS
jgi:hypothetical protein